ncbi:hypothetical protein D9M68_869540 [compost metagenome]
MGSILYQLLFCTVYNVCSVHRRAFIDNACLQENSRRRVFIIAGNHFYLNTRIINTFKNLLYALLRRILEYREPEESEG